MSPADRHRRRDLGIFAAYVALAVALTYPLITHITTAVPNDLGDPLLNTWILWWNAVRVPFTDAWWNAPAFYPADGVLTFSEHLLGLSPISTPIYWVTGNIQLGYNVALFASYPLSAFFGYLLCRDLTGRRDAAFIGGLIFGFTPYRIVQLPHIQVLCSYWMPITLLGLHRYLRDPRLRWLVVFGAGWLMQALCNGYYMAFLSVLVAVWIAWFVPWRRWRLLAGIAIAWGLAALPLIPIVLRYRAVHQFLGLRRSIDEMLIYSADMTSLLDHTDRLVVWRFMPAFHRSEGELFPGIAGVALVTIGLWMSRSRGQTDAGDRTMPPRRRLVRAVLTVLTVLFVTGAVIAAIAPWEFAIGPVTISGTHLHKPMSLALLSVVALVMTTPRVRRSMRGRTALGFYVFAAPLMWLFSFGPKPTFMGIQALYQGPYAWLMRLPGLDTLRTPARFHMVAILCLSCAAAICFARIAKRLPKRSLSIFTGVTTVVVMCDTLIAGFPLEQPPKPWPIQRQESASPVVEVPLGDALSDVDVMYRSMWTGNAVVNGYSGYGPPWYGAIDRGLHAHDPAVLQELSARGVRQLVLNTTADGAGDWLKYLATRPDIELAGDDGQHRLYRLPVAVAATTRAFGPPVHIAAISASMNQHLIPFLTDGDITTRWDSGLQKGTEVLTIDLGAPASIAAVVLAVGRYSTDAPRQLAIECSDDGQAWTEVWRGSGTGPAVRGAFADPIQVPATFDVGDRTARFLRLRQIGSDDSFFWSAGELRVLAPPAR